MLYVLECMFCGLAGVTDKPLITTGEKFTLTDIGVCLLGWGIVVLLIIFIRYCIAYAVRRYKDKKNDSSVDYEGSRFWGRRSFWGGILYIFECLTLPIKCMFGGKNVSLRSTGEKIKKDDVVYCVVFWTYLIVLAVDIVLICI